MSYSTHQIRQRGPRGPPRRRQNNLVRSLLQAGGALQAAGSIERGSTVSDFDPIEKERGHSIDAAIASTDHAGIHVNLVDTPGYPDFRGPALSALAAVETVAVVVDADAGVEYGTRRMMERAAERGLCRAVIVNKIDHDGADCARCPAAAARRVRAGSAAGEPAGRGRQEGRRPLLRRQRRFRPRRGRGLAPEDPRPGGRDQRNRDGPLPRPRRGGLSGAELHDAFEQCLREGHLVPVCFVSARSGVGVKELLDVAERLFPHPGEANPPPFVKGSGSATPEPIDAQPTRRRTSSPTCSRSSTIPSSASSPSSASTRARSGRIRSCSSTTARSRSRSATCSSSRARSTWRSRTRCPATSPRWRRWRNCTSTRCCTTATTRTRSTSRRRTSPNRCSASRSNWRARARNRSSRPRCTSWPRKTRRSRSNTRPSSTRP